MIYITGDTHSDFKRFGNKVFPEQKTLTKDDYVIICGDFGGIWNDKGETKEEAYWLKWLGERNFTLLFLDGNHENFDRLYDYPVKEWHGGKVHEIRPDILHLIRGQVYEIEGKTFFTFGGAASHDAAGGILDPNEPGDLVKMKHYDADWIPYRVKGISWWERELPSDEEMEEGLRNLAKVDNRVDYILTHCCSSSTQDSLARGADYKKNVLTDYLEKIKNTVSYRKWFFGHYHGDTAVSEKEYLIYHQIERIE